ncbi:NmrA-like protein [Cavenderia fasciculata]|uniref:NmrA-like protein n=1 Tax=Cavenderia fasciculata TaxID=261658 RepID=F4Q1L4_CACFS|nr:NmrA-like protein [Cavenderia fasciculata]EGG18715.1 NmrA-like protein [Cavenderia fasciculata]|eukprot:XP_004366619.1 NmrA-like protein [Cavenderia fasciculata]
MSTIQTQIVTVFGATGLQGGSVTQSLLNNPKYKVRAITRNPESDASLTLQKKGVELVKLDQTTATVEELAKALQGSQSVFLVTAAQSYGEAEGQVGKKIVDAVVLAKVEHFIFSSLVNCEKISNGTLPVTHFDQKDEIKVYAEFQASKNPTSLTVSFVYIPFYYQNFETFFAPKKSEDGQSYSITIPFNPKIPIAMADVTDVGAIVSAILENKTKYANASIPFCHTVSMNDIIQSLSKFYGFDIQYNYIPPQVFGTFPFPNAKEMGNMFQFYEEFGTFPGLDLSIAPNLTHITTFDEYLSKKKQ